MKKPSFRTLEWALFVLAVLLLVAALLPFIVPPSPRGGTIRGVVTDTSETQTGGNTSAPVVGVEVALYPEGQNTSLQWTYTSDVGDYVFYDVPEGNYEIAVEGFPEYRRTVTVTGPETLREDFLSAGGAAEGPSALEAGVSPSRLFTAVLVIASAALLAIVLYAKIHRDQLLQNVVRQRIHRHIVENPGVHYRAILDALALPMGVLTYHLNTMEKAELIKSRQDGVYRRFYPPGVRTDVTVFLSSIQEKIVAVIEQNRGISQAGIADELEISRPLVNYHVHILRDAGLVRLEPRGRETACFVDEAP